MNGWQCGIALAAMCVLPAAWPDAAQAYADIQDTGAGQWR